jgi:DNA polymerase elongation subunit (family B)
MWLIDTYRWNDQIIAWYKDNDKNTFHAYDYTTCIYAENTDFARRSLNRGNIDYEPVTRTDAYNENKTVLRIPVPNLQFYEAFVNEIERLCRYDTKLYNADIPPAQRFLYDHNIRPYDKISLDDDNTPTCVNRVNEPELTTADITIETEDDVRNNPNTPITKLVLDNHMFGGDEAELLKDFKATFNDDDPDTVFMRYAFRYIPYIQRRFDAHNIPFSFHRSHPSKITYRGGDSFFSYGNVHYRDYAIRLHGRFLIDRNTYLGDDNGIDGIIELAKLSGTRTQQLASRSFGAVTQGSLVRETIQDNKLVPHKHKPLSQPMRLSDYVKADKGGQYYDPLVGVHEDVAAIDFSSMFPNLICQYNICAEAILNDEDPRNNPPEIPVSMHTDTGRLANVLQPIMNQREYYKAEDDHEQRIQSLKGVLVSSYGYLRYREFKMGLAEAHMAICAYARHHLVESAQIAENHDSSVVHGLVDSLYVKKPGVTKDEVTELCDDIEEQTGLPISSDGIFDWIAFLRSKTDPRKPVVTRYFGVKRDGEHVIKGLTAVQQSQPSFLKSFQRDALDTLHGYAPNNVRQGEDDYASLIRSYAKRIPLKGAKDLSFQTKIRKTSYEKNCPQQTVINQLEERGVTVKPGYTLSYVKANDGVILPDAYNGQPDKKAYTEHLVDAFHELLRPFNYDKDTIREWTKPTRQTTLRAPRVKVKAP